MRMLFIIVSAVTFLSAVIPVQSAGATDDREWTRECVDCPKFIGGMRDHSLALDAAENPVTAYGMDHLYYARYTGSTWITETADESPATGAFASLALDAAFNPHISYQDGMTSDLKYAHKTGSTWTIETLDTNASAGYYTSIAVDAGSYPNIAYGNNQVGALGLYYVYADGSGWHYETATSGHAVFDVSLKLDSNDHPFIGYYDNYSQDLMLAYKTGPVWSIETIDSSGGDRASLDLDPGGYPHLSYSTGSACKYAYKDITGWHFETIAGTAIYSSSIDVDPSGWPHIAWSSGNQLNYSYKDTGGWHTVIVTTGTTQRYDYISLILTSTGYARITFTDFGTMNHISAFQTSSGWNLVTIDVSGDVGRDPSMDLDFAGYPHIAHYDQLHSDLKYTYKDGGGWHSLTVDGAGMTGMNPSMDVDSAGHPHISYYDVTNLNLRYAYFDGVTWLLENADPGPDNDGYLSGIAVDGIGQPHIIYYSSTNAYLKYAVRVAGVWQQETVDTTGIGQYPSLALDDDGYAHVAAYDGTNRTLVYLYQDGSGWHTETADNTYNTGKYASIALDSENRPHISYYDAASNDLKYAFRDGIWQTETVDGADFWVDWFTSVTVDASGFPHISYLDETHRDLKYAYKTASGWRTECVGDTGYTKSSLKLTGDGLPVIAYYDSNTYDLAVASGAPALPATGVMGVIILAALMGLMLKIQYRKV